MHVSRCKSRGSVRAARLVKQTAQERTLRWRNTGSGIGVAFGWVCLEGICSGVLGDEVRRRSQRSDEQMSHI